ncbi:MAG: hypothetical protein ACYC96_05545 [Fimbriimonadaceae bacterium]
MKLKVISKLVVIAAMAVSLSALSTAQTSGPVGGQPTSVKPARHGRHPLIAALSKLNLTPAQKSQIAGMLKQRKADNKTFRKANAGNLPALKAHRKQEARAFMASLKTVLSKPQWQKFEAELKAMKGRARRKSNTLTPPA